MFTGIIRDIGIIREFKIDGDAIATINTSLPIKDLTLGASVCCSGACMTVISSKEIDKNTKTFTIEISKESLSKTNLGEWKKGTKINLEPSLKLGDELGGHMVTGHIDGLSKIISINDDAKSKRFLIKLPKKFKHLIAPKGSISLDGASLTVNDVKGSEFSVNIIPHTLSHTTFGLKAVGDEFNFEVDILARYVNRMLNN